MPATINEAELRKSLTYQKTAPPSSVLADLDVIRRSDNEAEKKARFWGIIVGCSAVVAVIGIAYFVLMEMAVAGAVIGGVGLAFLISGAAMRALRGKLDVDDRRYELVAGLLHYLSRDMSASENVSVTLDLLPHNHKKKYQSSGKVGYWNAKFYLDPWLTMTGRLLDGTRYSITMIEKQQDRHRTKRSASGKLKTKRKTKNASEAIVTLRVKEKRYPKVAALATAVDPGSVRLPAWVNVKSVGVEGESLAFRSTTKSGWDVNGIGDSPASRDGVNWVAMKLIYLYSLLNSAKKA